MERSPEKWQIPSGTLSIHIILTVSNSPFRVKKARRT